MKVVLISADCEWQYNGFNVLDAYHELKQKDYLHIPCYRVDDEILAPMIIVDTEWFNVEFYLRNKRIRHYRTFHRYFSRLMKRDDKWRKRFETMKPIL